MEISPPKQAKAIVVKAKLKEKDATGKLVFVAGTRQFPILGNPNDPARAISMFVNRMLRRKESKYAKPEIYCYIESPEGNLLATYKGGHEVDKTHKSKYRLVHLLQGKEVATIWSTLADELNDERAPWQLVNRYRPQRKIGYCAVYEGSKIVEREGKRLAWTDGKRKP